jgi:hypothetical protein
MRRVFFAFLPAIALFAPTLRADDAGTGPVPAPMPTTGMVLAKQCTELDTKCQRGAFTVSKSEKIAADFDFDTGWLPKDAPVQVRLLTYLHGRTRVDMSGTIDATWPDPIRLRPDGVRETGLLAIDDGLVVKAMARFKVSIAGKEYSWSGDLPGVPKVDLASVTHVHFDPFAWKGAPLPPQTSGKTKQMEIFRVPLTDAIIPIPGIEGGFQLEGQGEFFAEYSTLRIGFDELTSPGAVGDIDPTKTFTQVLFSSSPSLENTLNIHGELTRQTNLHFIPGLYFEILGKKFDLELVDIPVALPASTKAWDFDPVTIHFPLPRIEARPNPIELGEIPVGKETSVLVTVFDTGEAKLVIDASDPKDILAVTTKHVEVPGGSSDSIRATLTPKDNGPIDTTLLLESNDPAAPKLSIRVTANAGGAAGTDPDTEAAGGCGCRTMPANNTSLAPLSLAVAALIRRRRRR